MEETTATATRRGGYAETKYTEPAAAERSPKKTSILLRPTLSARKPATRLNRVDTVRPPVSTRPICHSGSPRDLR